MSLRFRRHYTLDEARALLPELRRWLTRLQQLHRLLVEGETRIRNLMAGGHDVGGLLVNRSLQASLDSQQVLEEFREREILLKDLDRGLVDFPALRDGREVFLCWELDEEDITHWHDLDAGYAGREEL